MIDFFDEDFPLTKKQEELMAKQAKIAAALAAETEDKEELIDSEEASFAYEAEETAETDAAETDVESIEDGDIAEEAVPAEESFMPREAAEDETPEEPVVEKPDPDEYPTESEYTEPEDIPEAEEVAPAAEETLTEEAEPIALATEEEAADEEEEVSPEEETLPAEEESGPVAEEWLIEPVSDIVIEDTPFDDSVKPEEADDIFFEEAKVCEAETETDEDVNDSVAPEAGAQDEEPLMSELKLVLERLDNVEKTVSAIEEASRSEESDESDEQGFSYEYDDRYFAEEETLAYKYPEIYSSRRERQSAAKRKKERSGLFKDSMTIDPKTVLKVGAVVAATAAAVKLLSKKDD